MRRDASDVSSDPGNGCQLLPYGAARADTLPTVASVTSILIYPDKGEPGQALESTGVGEEGLDGDRRKGAPVHLVAVADYVEAWPRANVVVDLEPDTLAGLVGRRLRIGDVELHVTGPAKSCPGVYADVPVPGTLAVGDEIEVGVPGA